MEKETGFYCPYWGKCCELCMEDAEDEDYE